MNGGIEMLLSVKEVMKILGVSQSKAYQIIQELNEEMKRKGYLTVRGRISKIYFYERMGLQEEDRDE